MSMSTHLTELERKHRALERKIADELAHPAMDESKIAAWKREKLHLKDRITQIRNGHPPDRQPLH